MREGVNEVVDIVVNVLSKVRQCGELSGFWEGVKRLLDELLGLLVEDVLNVCMEEDVLKVLWQLLGLVVVIVIVVDNDRLVVVKFVMVMVFMVVNDRLGLVVVMVFMLVNDRLGLVVVMVMVFIVGNDRLRLVDMVIVVGNDRLFSKPGPSLVPMFSASTAPSSQAFTVS